MFFHSSFPSLYFSLVFSNFLSFVIALHFLGGSFTYRDYPGATADQQRIPVLVEIRLHISNHYFICSPQQVNDHLIVFLVGERIAYDQNNHVYLWHDAEEVHRNKDFYKIQCVSARNNAACRGFDEEMWAYCESANPKNGYSILRRQFLMNVERFKTIKVVYVCMHYRCRKILRRLSSLRVAVSFVCYH